MARLSWLWSKITGFFSRGGKTITDADAIDLRNQLAERSMELTGELSSRLGLGEITLAKWQAEMTKVITNATTGQYLLAIGGKTALTEELTTALGEIVGEQLGYLKRFSGEIATGNLSPEAIASRGVLYGESSIGAYERGVGARKGLTLPTFPPLHGRCRCHWDHGDDTDGPFAIWVTAEDERVCEICTGIERQYGAGSPYREVT